MKNNYYIQKKILIIESETCSQAAEKALKDKYQIFVHSQKKNALTVTKWFDPDLVIVNLEDDDCDFDLQEYISTLHRQKYKVVVITSSNSKEKQIKWFKSGAHDVIEKPFDLQIMSLRIDALVGKDKELDEEHIIRTRVVKIDSKLKLAIIFTKANSPKNLNLTPRQFVIFEALVKSKNQTLTREEMISTIGGTRLKTERNVDFDIHCIRKKIGTIYKENKLKPKNLIITVPGVGYMFTEEIEEKKTGKYCFPA